jgi:polysaccharide export outer membrane protein
MQPPPANDYPVHANGGIAGQPITILGQVEHPGVFPLFPREKLTEIITAAGGPTATARRWAKLSRRDDRGSPRVYRISLERIANGAAPDPELAPGDVVIVESVDD